MSQVHFAGSEFDLTLQPLAEEAHEDEGRPGMASPGISGAGHDSGPNPMSRAFGSLARFVTARVLARAHIGTPCAIGWPYVVSPGVMCASVARDDAFGLPRIRPFQASAPRSRHVVATRSKGSPRGAQARHGAIMREAPSRVGLGRRRASQGVDV